MHHQGRSAVVGRKVHLCGGDVLLLANPTVTRAVVLVNELEARGVVRKAGHAVLIIVLVLIVLGVLLGVGLTAMFRRRR